MTDDRLMEIELRGAAQLYEQARIKTEAYRQTREKTIRKAIAKRMTHAKIAEATGLSRGRIGQMAMSAPQPPPADTRSTRA